jgi:hypothetical protein
LRDMKGSGGACKATDGGNFDKVSQVTKFHNALIIG